MESIENIKFAVSAKMARLIGRENISDVDSAVIELIKNAYDADATCVFVEFNMPFPSVPKEIPFELAVRIFGENTSELLFPYYERTTKCFEKKKFLTNEEEKALEELLFSRNAIIIMDNGHGMDASALRMAWMNIGTSNKEEQKVSPGGRTKTGAKGIGRFALDKLSIETVVHTKSVKDQLLRWHINWNQFETASLLSDVNATMESLNEDFEVLVESIAGDRIENFREYSWKSGTIIELHPCREPWSTVLFERINKNLKSLFPDTNKEQFDIYVHNVFYRMFDFKNERFSLKDSDYDYKIDANFDGKNTLVITLHRNEVDTRKIKVELVDDSDKKHSIPLSNFWMRDVFQKENYSRSDYAKAITLQYDNASELIDMPLSSLAEVGAFSTELYFLKNTSSTVDIIKPISSARRKEVLSNFSGIKLYRDGFKVRPYGEEGALFDWIELGVRAQKSPSGISSTGSWRVLPYQMIGAVRITKQENTNLVDMANREGLAVNSAYRIFTKIIEKIIETFEADRQRPYREYFQWSKEKKSELSKAANIADDIKKRRENENKASPSHAPSSAGGGTSRNGKYSSREYESAVSYLQDEKQQLEQATQTMMMFSSAGVMTNTFSHEISRIMTATGSRMQHIRESVKQILGSAGYTGDPDFEPFFLIDEAEKTDKLLEDWLNIIMDGVHKDAYIKKELSPQAVVQKIINRWTPMLEKKHINVLPPVYNIAKDCKLNCSEIDLYIIFNNFFLNSAWFLEKSTADQREIRVELQSNLDSIVFTLENNGPPLDGRFINNPDKIFEAGITTKKVENNEGTGLGLWIAKTIVDNNSGQIHSIDKVNGFGLRIILPKLR